MLAPALQTNWKTASPPPIEPTPLTLHILALAQSLALLAVANGAPVIAKRLLGETFAWPIDGGWSLRDGQPLFGKSKTVRGVALAVIGTAIAGWLVGPGPGAGAAAGLAAMAGDLTSSFAKRRLKLAPSSEAPGLDQVPESLLPLLLLAERAGLSAIDVVLGVALFWGGEMVLSRWLYALKVRDRPY